MGPIAASSTCCLSFCLSVDPALWSEGKSKSNRNVGVTNSAADGAKNTIHHSLESGKDVSDPRREKESRN